MQSNITLRQVWRDYLSARELKQSTIRNHMCRQKVLRDWFDLDIREITKDMVEQKHLSLRDRPVLSNSTFKILRTLYNYAKWKYENEDGSRLVNQNPVDRLSELRLWYKERPRKVFIPLRRLPDWWRAISNIENQTTRDFFVLLLLTGLRHEEAASLLWEDIDLTSGFLTARDTKNGTDHTLPLSNFLTAFLGNRKTFQVNEYVFPSRNGHLYFSNPYKSVEAVREQIRINFTPHDLRRTFIAVAQNVGIDEFTRKRLLNHSFGDVTGKHYSVDDPETLREPMQRITDRVLNSVRYQKAAEDNLSRSC